MQTTPAISVSVFSRQTRLSSVASSVHFGFERVFLDELPPRFDDVAHEFREHLVRRIGVLDFDLE